MSLWCRQRCNQHACWDPHNGGNTFEFLVSVKPALHWRQNDISVWCFYSLGSLNYDYRWKHTCRSAKHKWSPRHRLWEVLLHPSPLFAFNTSSAHESQEMSLPPASEAFLISPPASLQGYLLSQGNISAAAWHSGLSRPLTLLGSPTTSKSCLSD